ncbi:hypothetical protein FGO68_gene11760 [Halteria grandinella]|uniref:Uncharacterized protein n=1 Tax=Halteria grandinella TaxID=5974 RepID=A0A8J8SWJ0_HALGN|nr:hypothetical protein FGO68_gene11760 [Halteria grandinella]
MLMVSLARLSEHCLLRLLSLILRNLQLINHSFDFNYNSRRRSKERGSTTLSASLAHFQGGKSQREQVTP